MDYKRIHIYYMNTFKIEYFINGVQKTTAYSSKKWGSDELRTLIFNEEPTGALLKWLQANATLQ